jgi:addiction module HigA family antidote
MKRTTLDEDVFVPSFAPPPTPGEILSEEFLKPLGIGVSEFADRIGVTRATISRIINGRSAVTPTMAMRFGRALGTSYHLWVRLQLSTDLYAAAHSPESSAIAKIGKISVRPSARENADRSKDAASRKKPPSQKRPTTKPSPQNRVPAVR